MANELQTAHSAAAATLYAIIRDSTGRPLAGATPEAYVTANLGNYDVPLTEQGTASQFYSANFPAAAAGSYVVSYYVQGGGSPAEGDTHIRTERVEWDGTAMIVRGAVRSIANNAITAASINTAAITAAKFDAGAIDAAAIAADAITAAKIANGAIDANTFAAGAINAAALDTGAITAAKFAAGAIDAAALAADAGTEIATAVWALTNGIETSYTPKQSMRIILSAVAGKSSGAGTGTVVYRDVGDSADRISATIVSNNRTAVTLTA